MRIVVLPFNAAAGASHALARQYATVASEIAKRESQQEVDSLNYIAQFQDEGITRIALVNTREDLNDAETIEGFYQSQPDVENISDGLLTENEDGSGSITFRTFVDKKPEPKTTETFDYAPGELFSALRKVIKTLTEFAGGKWRDELNDDTELFGTANSEAYKLFLKGFDDGKYIEQASGNVRRDFTPQDAIDNLIQAAELDKDWEGPLHALLHVVRTCTAFRIGNSDMLGGALNRALQVYPEEPRLWFARGELLMAIGDFPNAADSFERAHKFEPEEPAILARLATCQMQLGMPANAERNLRKAIELEGEEKPSLDLLTAVLDRTGRNHEVPELWKDQVTRNPQDPGARAKHAISLINNGRKEDGIRAFDAGMEELEDNIPLKRFYAPVLVNEGDVDRAMDFYEDYLDENPNDVQAMIEYAQTLQKAEREFEIPPVLKNILASNPDQNTRAQISAWLIEIEQPKRAEAVKSASEKAEKGDHDGAIRELKPLKQWLSDYWKLWVVMATSQNQLNQYADAEQSARQALSMFPACEPGYVELNNALAGQEKFDEAYAIMQVAVQNMNQSLPVAISYGLAAKRVGREDEAKALARSIREAVGTQPELEPVLEELER